MVEPISSAIPAIGLSNVTPDRMLCYWAGTGNVGCSCNRLGDMTIQILWRPSPTRLFRGGVVCRGLGMSARDTRLHPFCA